MAAASLSGLVGCNDNQGSFTPIVIDSFGADNAQPTIGQNITLTWSYNFDRPDVQARSSFRLTSQRLIIKRLFLIGIAEQAIGPNPIGQAPGLGVTARSFVIQFNGPIVVQLQGSFDATLALDNSDFRPICSAMLTLRLRQDLFCKAQFNCAQQNVRYPYLGYPQNRQGVFSTSAEVDFTQFVAFRDAGAIGQMDLAARAPNLFPRDQNFRALSFSGNENVSFLTRSGSTYPPQVFGQPQAGQTNAMLFAGAIVFNGLPLPAVKDQDTQARRAPLFADQQSRAIFVAIPMLFGEATRQLTIADIHAGTALDPTKVPVPQRALVLTALSTPGQLATGNLGSTERLALVASGTGELLQGDIKGATLVHDVTTLAQESFTSAVNMSIQWSCQFLPDDQLDNVLAIGN